MGRTALSVVVVVALATGGCTSATPSPPSLSATPSPPSATIAHAPSFSASVAPVSPGASATPSPPGIADPFTIGQFPEPPTHRFADATEAALQAVLDAAVANGLPGVTATVLAANGGAWSGAAGRGGLSRPAQTSSAFCIASITKTVIASEVMRLAEQGLLRLTDPVAEHLPGDLALDTNGATVQDLLAMRSGIPDPGLSSSEVAADSLRRWDISDVLATVPAVRFAPNERFRYEDANYMILALLIEEKTGTTVAGALRSGILADARLAALVYQPEERPQGPLALPGWTDDINYFAGYTTTISDASSANGSGGMASDSEALAMWGYLLFGGLLISEESLVAMTDFGDDWYGLSVWDYSAFPVDFGVDAFGNGGWGLYSSSVLTVLPTQGIVISVLTNMAGNPRQLVLPVSAELAASLER